MRYYIVLIAPLLLGLASTTHSSQRTHYSGEAKKGIDFFIVGDFGYIGNMTNARRTFQKMDDVLANASNDTDPENLIDFIMTAGDNIYPTIAEHPQDWEFNEVLDLFQSENLKNLPVYPVRGNHDCKFSWDREIKLS